LGNFDPSFGQSDVGAVAQQQRIPEPIANPEANDTAEYRPLTPRKEEREQY
jgi:hypothetical protein